MADKGEWKMTEGQYNTQTYKEEYRDVRDKEITTLTSYLYLGYTNLLLVWLRYKKASSKDEVMTLLKPIIMNVIKDINESPNVFANVKANNLEANQTIREILLKYK